MRYWAERTPIGRRRSHPAFRGTQTADAVVIGGGHTGATAAYVLAAGGLGVVLLEADRIASGATAASPGIIAPEPDGAFIDVEEAAGRRAARVAWAAARKSARDLSATLDRLKVRCDLAPAPLVINARTSDEAARLRREQAARRAAGIDSSWMTGATTLAEIGSESSGALKLSGGHVFDPVRATLGLVTAAESRGARVFEHSPVTRTRFTRKHADVVLRTGSIRTTAIIVATGEPGALFGPLRRHTRRATGYAVVTEPLVAAMRRAVGRRATVATEPGPDRRWLRWLSDDRILFAGVSGPPAARSGGDKIVIQRSAQLMYELSLRHPVISGLPARWGWAIPVVTTPDGLPWIGPHRNYPFHFFSLAFGWHSDGLAFHAAKAALRFFRGEARFEDTVLGFARYL